MNNTNNRRTADATTRTRAFGRALISGVALAAISAAVMAADAPQILPEQQIERVKVQDVQLRDGTVHGVVVNNSNGRIEDLTLRVSYQWRWQNEFHPGSDNPGFSMAVHVDEPLAPGESRTFEYAPQQGLPMRSDGSFAPEVSVVSFTAYGDSGRVSAVD